MNMETQMLVFLRESRGAFGIAGALLLFVLGIITTFSATLLFYCFFCIVWNQSVCMDFA